MRSVKILTVAVLAGVLALILFGLSVGLRSPDDPPSASPAFAVTPPVQLPPGLQEGLQPGLQPGLQQVPADQVPDSLQGYPIMIGAAQRLDGSPTTHPPLTLYGRDTVTLIGTFYLPDVGWVTDTLRITSAPAPPTIAVPAPPTARPRPKG
ncbi:MAG TPA: hypothetical protein VFS08_04715 [Gemmatimonadaceae bacterium]|nr:hypothetical protein [Gemmatimonadaceae bacterium]